MVEIKRFCYISSPLQAVQEKVVNASNAKSINSAYSIIKHLAVAGMEKAKAMGCIAVSGVLTIDAAMDIYNPVWNTEKEVDANNIKRHLIESAELVLVVSWNGEAHPKEVLEDVAYGKELGKEIVYGV